ncbi:hypothetical protein MRX96_053662, partial [Rhipicephalus microplus]
QQAQGKNVPSVASQRAKQLQWRPKNTPRIEEDDIIVVLHRVRHSTSRPRLVLDKPALQYAASSETTQVWDLRCGPLWDQYVLVCTLKSVDAAERLLRDIKLPAAAFRYLLIATPDGPTEHQCIPSCLLCGGGHKTGAPGCAGRFRQPVKSGSPRGSKPRTTGGKGGEQTGSDSQDWPQESTSRQVE